MEKCIAPSRNLGKSSKNKLESGHEVPSIYTFLNRRKKNIARVRARIQATGPVPKQDFANKVIIWGFFDNQLSFYSQIVGVVFACCLSKNIRAQYETV